MEIFSTAFMQPVDHKEEITWSVILNIDETGWF